MPLGLLKYGFSSKYPAKHHFTPAKDLKKHYDVLLPSRKTRLSM